MSNSVWKRAEIGGVMLVAFAIASCVCATLAETTQRAIGCAALGIVNVILAHGLLWGGRGDED